MSVQITSTTDSAEQITAALGNKAETKVEQKSASSEQKNETAEESDASENEEQLDAKEGDDDSSEEQESKEGDDKPKKKSGFKKRIDKLTKRLSAKEQETEYWKQEALKRNSQQEPQPKDEVKAPTTLDLSSKPKENDFESHEEWLEAITDWKIDQREKSKEAKQKEAQVKTEHQKAIDAHTERVEKFAKATEDFHDVLEDVDDIPLSLTVQQVILASDNGPELMYELAKNKAEYARICKLAPIEAARELGKFEAKIAKQSDTKTESTKIKKTNAPPPIATVGSKAALSQKNPEEMSMAEYNAWRDQGGGR